MPVVSKDKHFEVNVNMKPLFAAEEGKYWIGYDRVRLLTRLYYRSIQAFWRRWWWWRWTWYQTTASFREHAGQWRGRRCCYNQITETCKCLYLHWRLSIDQVSLGTTWLGCNVLLSHRQSISYGKVSCIIHLCTSTHSTIFSRSCFDYDPNGIFQRSESEDFESIWQEKRPQITEYLKKRQRRALKRNKKQNVKSSAQ